MDIFCARFPSFKNDIVSYSEAGKNAVRIVMKDKYMLVFTYTDEQTWMLETLKNYAQRTK